MNTSPVLLAVQVHPEIGTIRALASFAPHVQVFFEDMIANEDARCVSIDGERYVPQCDVEAYWCADIQEDWEQAAALPLAALHNDPIRAASIDQLKADQAIVKVRAALRATIDDNVAPRDAHPFALNPWISFWSDVAFVAAGLADDIAAIKIEAAVALVTDSVGAGALNTVGLAVFHQTLLALADQDLSERFDDIWQDGKAKAFLPDPVGQSSQALNQLRRLSAVIAGSRGTPEGSVTARSIMSTYLTIIKFSVKA